MKAKPNIDGHMILFEKPATNACIPTKIPVSKSKTESLCDVYLSAMLRHRLVGLLASKENSQTCV